ncbi:MAG TPA: hypothetical protein VFQ00_12770 [Terriglobales bacterium]|nr:hypothetical protein [Terriglobales bacterium]
MQKVFRILLSILAAGALGMAQNAAETPSASDAQAVVNAQFGSQFKLIPGISVLVGDFNGDGIPDAAFAVKSDKGVQIHTDQYKVLDPSDEYFGYSDPEVTSTFVSQYPTGPRYLLILHGSGKDGWHAKNPTAKFVLINVVFDRISVGRITHKKHSYDDIDVQQTGVLDAFIWWNGKKYKWQPGAAQG